MPARPPALLVAPLVFLCVLAAAPGCGSGSKRQPGALGADCLQGREAACASSLCLSLDSSTAYCSQACQVQGDCPQGFLCLAAAGNGLVCQARGAGGVCGVDDDCPAGLKCDAAAGHCYIPVTRSACGPCSSDKQCGQGGVCHPEGHESFCAAACDAQNRCAAGYTCSSGHCLPSGGSCRGGRALCASCAGDLECGKPGDLCVRNLQSQETFCAAQCTTSAGCPHGFSCMDLSGKGQGPNQCIPDSGTCAGYCDSTDPAAVQRACGLGAACDLPNRTCVRATDGSLCAACASDDDCTHTSPAARCVVNRTAGSPFLGEHFCGSDCSQGTCPGAGCAADASKCGAGFSCAGIGAQGSWPFQCVPSRGSCEGGFSKLGDTCAGHGAADCLSGICAQLGIERRCTAACTADADCGDPRWRCCLSVGADKFDCSRSPAGANGGVCAPVGGSFGDDCAPGSSPCQEGLCLDLGTAQLCTRGCDAAHACGPGFSCQGGTLENADGSLGSGVRVCFPDGGGGVGSACAFGPAACKSHLCLKKESGNVCTANCATSADCPATWSCADEDTAAGVHVTVCLPPGTGP